MSSGCQKLIFQHRYKIKVVRNINKMSESQKSRAAKESPLYLVQFIVLLISGMFCPISGIVLVNLLRLQETAPGFL